MEVSSIAVATGVDTIGAAGRAPAADGACWWDGGVGRAFDKGAVAPRVPIHTTLRIVSAAAAAAAAAVL